MPKESVSKEKLKSTLDTQKKFRESRPKPRTNPGGPQMRARTTKEGISDFFRDAYEGVANSPLGKIGGLLGLGQGVDFETPGPDPNDINDPRNMKVGMMPFGPGRGLFKGPAPSPTQIRKTHPLAPNEFNKTMSSRTGPIDMNDLPPGKMEYLDPGIAEYMSPKQKPFDATTREGQRRIQFLTRK